MAKTFKVTLVKSLIGCTESQRATLTALGLRKRHHSIAIADNAANRGQVMKVQHLVNVVVEK